MKFDVQVQPVDSDRMLKFTNVDEVAFVNNETFGAAQNNSANRLNQRGNSIVLIYGENVSTVVVTRTA